MTTTDISIFTEQGFATRYVKTDGGCWLWTGALQPNGYGVLGKRGGVRYAHRMSYEIHRGPIPAGMFVCHRCDVRACVNPAHLFLGTPADNIHDMIAKGRRVTYDRHGERNPRAKLDAAQIPIIRERRRAGATLASLAREYGVGTSQIFRIVTREQWT